MLSQAVQRSGNAEIGLPGTRDRLHVSRAKQPSRVTRAAATLVAAAVAQTGTQLQKLPSALHATCCLPGSSLPV